jgi:ABC-type multidrug transport system permease subunit
MQVYKSFFKVLRHYKLSFVIYTGITLAMLFALVMSNSPESKQVALSRYPIVVVDNDHSEVSEALYSYLDSAHDIKKEELTDDQIKDLMYYWHLVEYIEIPEGFGESFKAIADSKDEVEATSLLKCIYDESLPRGIFINMQMNEYLNGISGYLSSGFSMEEADERTRASLDSTQYVEILQKEVEPAKKSYTAFLFIPYGILSIIFSQLLPVITSFNGKEKKNRTAISSTSMIKRNVALVAGTITISLIVVALMVTVATFSEGTKYLFTKMWWMSVLNAFVYMVTVTMMLSMISSLPIGLNQKGSANTSAFITNIIGLSFSFLGGTFVGLEIMGDGVAKIGRFIPNYWYSIATRRIWYEGAGLTDVFDCFGLQLVFGITCLAIGLAFTRFYKDTSRN